MTRAISAFALSLASVALAAPRQISGIYPHLAMFNDEGECGTGAVVPWADRLWVITYGPHLPKGSSDKLYEITPDLQQIIRPESIGGTPANRMIHGESQQLFIGPYAIDAKRNVRVIPYTTMFGRLTGVARHLTDPAGKIVFATMEEGIYEVDVRTLQPATLWADEQVKEGRHANLPGYHGKGFYSAQGLYIYANNGDHAKEALTNPATPSGVLAGWDGKADQWTVVRRNQFTEVTGPGGISGGKPDDPVWSIGWDHRSLILMLLDGGKWHTFRLPKASNSYDGAHGWNTEWPRIREVGGGALLMTMHGMFWGFPSDFSMKRPRGIRPLSSYLKVIGDFCEWNGYLVFGCDDTAKNEFLNKRAAKGKIAAPQSQSNLWFVKRPADFPKHALPLYGMGPTLSQGAVWLGEDVNAGQASDLFLFDPHSSVFLAHRGESAVTLLLETGTPADWRQYKEIVLPPGSGQWVSLDMTLRGVAPPWIRVRCAQPLTKATALFVNGSARMGPDSDREGSFTGVADVKQEKPLAATVHARGENKGTLHYMPADGSALYELDADLKLQRVDDPAALAFHKANCAIPAGVLSTDAASVIYTDDSGKLWRLPKGDAAFDKDTVAGPARVCREVCTERDLFNAHGTFYEVPAENAGGFAKVRPVCTHNRRIHDYCSWRGLLIMTGIEPDAPAGEHILRSDDGKAALWAGVVDDLWKLPPPRGTGGPWKDTPVKAGAPSDPYLMWGYFARRLKLDHSGAESVSFSIELDLTGDDRWVEWKSFNVSPGEKMAETIPQEVQARWLRVIADKDTTATARLEYK